MSGKRRKLWTGVVSLTLVSGCASSVGHMATNLERHGTEIELTGVPFHAQVTDQCGPAALAMMLNDADVRVTPEELRSRIYIPDREGSLQLEILAATRQYGRIPYTIDADVIAVLRELESGRPVMVLQNLGARLVPVWHYAVVVGYLPDERHFVLRSGDRRRHLMNSRAFLRAWQRGEYWGVVALRPGELPTDAEPERYLRSVAAMEAVGGTAAAVLAYRAATERWPRNSLAWLGLGNASYAQGELHAARDAYRKVLDLQPGDVIAMNNLSQVHADLGCRDDALATINSALSASEAGDPMHRHLRQTLADIEQGDPAARCL